MLFEDLRLCLHFSDWDTLAFWLTALATIYLAYCAGKGLESWQLEFKQRIHSDLYGNFIEFVQSIKNLGLVRYEREKLNIAEDKYKHIKLLLAKYSLYISKDLYFLFQKNINEINNYFAIIKTLDSLNKITGEQEDKNKYLKEAQEKREKCINIFITENEEYPENLIKRQIEKDLRLK